ncbi:MAG: hypothetical protein M1832_001260 [Thelocarpon impressellum]|nr:MAG: hypothetical protein M1832_001260 [Thelocarpon impressellum]
MTELVFAKSFLATLDARPVRLSADHVEDPRKYPARGAYTLPKMSRPMSKRRKLAPGQERSVGITLKSVRNPPLDISVPHLPVSASVLDLKHIVTERTGVPADKVRLLLNKKPCPDSKTIKELVPDGQGVVEFGIMVVGGAATVAAAAAPAAKEAPAAQGPSGAALLETDTFWDDLQAYLMQRLKDEGEGREALRVFKEAWKGRGA